MPTDHRKLEKLSELPGKLRKSYRKIIGRSSTGLQSRQILMVQALRTTKEDDNVDFSFLQRQLFTSVQAEALEREFLLRSALGAECLSTPRIAFANKTQEKTSNVLLLEKTRIHNVRRTSKHFPTTKVDLLTIKVVLAITRTITVSRNVAR